MNGRPPPSRTPSFLRMLDTSNIHDKYCSCSNQTCKIRKYIITTNELVDKLIHSIIDVPDHPLPPHLEMPLRKLVKRLHDKLQNDCEATPKITFNKAHPNYCFWCRKIWNHVRGCRFCKTKIYLCDDHKVLDVCCME